MLDRSALLAACPALLLTAGAVRAVEQLPIIVTYEMQREHAAARLERRDPRSFWIQQIVARLEDKKPAGRLGLMQPATALVSFVVGHDGRLVSKAIQASSKVAIVDQEALAMLDRAQPFAPMPATMSEADMSFTLPLRIR